VPGRLQRWAGELRAQVVTLWFCRRHPGTPWAAKLLAAIVVAYAFSPIDLIPDFIPVLGYLDDLVIVPLGILPVLWLVPAALMAGFRLQAATLAERPRSTPAAIVIVLIWIALTALACWWLWHAFAG
jgi:uncharacterized membrane protein YkvA (DUF1232 family)